MVRSVRHDMLPVPTHDEAARQQYVVAFKQFLNRHVRPTNRRVFAAEAAPAFAGTHGHAPGSRQEIRASMYASPRYRSWCAFNRSAQELMWDALADTIEREQPRLAASAAHYLSSSDRKGSLELDPDFVPPKDVTTVDIHL
ncbi:MAG TPA: hypothetical protein VLT59_15260, partial [Steroidobacteraceae bacterium]|nr:hypothetical protein [Steroidobacteraceae bacterium]